MKKTSLTPLQWTALIGMVVIGLLGGGGIWYLSQRLGDAQAAVQEKDTALRKLVGQRYLPSTENIEILQQDNKILDGAIDALQQRLRAPGNKLADVKEKNPVVFKQDLAEILRSLGDLAAKNNVRLDPAAASFGFSSYQNNNPTEAATRVLGKQLVGIEEVGEALIKAKVGSINAVRRTFDENAVGNASYVPSSSAGGAAVGSISESLRARILSPSEGLYTVYPLEVEFTGSEESLRTFLENLGASPYVLITRFLIVNSTHANPPRVDDLSHAVDSATRKPTFIVAMGDDDLHVRARIDLIDWSGKATKAPQQGGKGNGGKGAPKS